MPLLALQKIRAGLGVTPFLAAIRISGLLSKLLLALVVGKYLSLSSLGEYGLIIGFATIFPAFARFGLFNVTSRSAVTQSGQDTIRDLRHYLPVAIAPYVILAAASPFISIQGLPHYVALVVLVALLEHIATDLVWLNNGQKRPVPGNVVYFLQTAGWIFPYIVSVIVLPELRTIPALLTFWACGCGLAIVYGLISLRDWPWAGLFQGPIVGAWYRSKFKPAINLYVADVLTTFANQSDRYLVSFALGLEATGVYVLFWQFGNAISNLISTSYVQIRRPYLVAKASNIADFSSEFATTFRTTTWYCLATFLPLATLLSIALPSFAPEMMASLESVGVLADAQAAIWVVLLAAATKTLADLYFIRLYALHRDTEILYSAILSISLTPAFVWVGLIIGGMAGAGAANVLAFVILILYRRHLAYLKHNT